MKRVAVLAFLLLAATAASAQQLSDIRITPQEITMRVGETVTVHGFGIFSWGGAFPWNVQFFSQDPSVAEASGGFAKPHTSTDIVITARSLGETGIVSNWKRYPMAVVRVICNDERSVVPVATPIAATALRPVKLGVTGENLAGRTYQWFLGRSGDWRHRLDGNGPEISFTPGVPGTHYVWLLATTQCSTSIVEFRIDANPSKRRSTRS